MLAREIKLKIIPNLEDGLSDEIHRGCSFCGKLTKINLFNNHFSWNSSPKFYCAFCLRNNFNYKTSRNVLIMTFKGIIGYYYHMLYKSPKVKRSIYISTIEDMVADHAEVGLKNPSLYYDPESFLWFVDFNKIGVRKMPINYIHESVVDILSCFNLKKHIQDFKPKDFYEKFSKAIQVFYENRQRPVGKRILCPTLIKCGGDTTFNYEILKNFMLKDLKF